MICPVTRDDRGLLINAVTTSITCNVPDWARDAVWYQIFPERFRNGAVKSNPRIEDITEYPVPGWTINPWGADWYRAMPWEQAPAHGRGGVYLRRYGGDLVGVREKLDYLQELGVNALYLNPVFTARSLHKYDGATFHHIDPTFGPDRDGDIRALAAAKETEDPSTWIWTAADRYLLDLVKEVHRREMRIILDGVFNHTGREFFAFQDLLKHGRNSKYVDWYLVQQWRKNGSFEYKGWFNHKALPEFNRTSDNLAEPVRQYIFDCTRRWMDPENDGDCAKGIDGWRLDVAFCVPHGFWRDWRTLVKSINPDAYLTAEIVADATDYLQGDQFDAVMNYMWTYPTVRFFSPAQKPLDKSALQRRLDKLRAAYPPEVTPVLQNLLDSHDVGRIASMLENPDTPKLHWEDYFHVSRVKENPCFVTTRPGIKAWSALKQIVVFQMTYPGAPMLYYGTEVGMWGANDPDNRQPMLWDDIVYEPEEHTPKGKTAGTPRAPDQILFRFFTKAIRLRTEQKPLRRGTFQWVRTGSRRLLGYDRTYNCCVLRVLLNASDEPIRYRLESGALDLWNKAEPVSPGRVTVEPRGWRVLELMHTVL